MLLMTVMPLAADSSWASLVPAESLERLEAGEQITHTLKGAEPLQLIPAIGAARQIAAEIQGLGITTGVETLRLYSSRAGQMESERARLAIYNVLRSVSTMEGIQYYSATRKRMRTLFAASYVIEGARSEDRQADLPREIADPPRRIPDPLVERIPAYDVQYLFQEDLTFGKNIYRAEYLAPPEGFLLKTRNLTLMRYHFLPMVKPEDSLMVIMVLPYGRHILFYGLMAAHTPSFLGIERSRAESFYNRLDALYGWFVRAVSEVLDEG